AAIALSFVDDSALATTTKDITAGGAVSFTASADGASKAHAIAGASGADSKEEGDKGSKSADDQQSKTKALAETKSGKSKSVDSKAKANTDSESKDSGSVGVAASDAEASVGMVTISAADKFTLKSENHMDASAIADGSAAKGTDKKGDAS